MSLIEKCRNECLKRGTSGIKSIGQMFLQIDDDRSGNLTLSEFKQGIINHNIQLTDEEIDCLFKEIDRDNSGTIRYNEFLEKIRPPLNQTRLSLIKKAFDKIDKTGDGKATIDDLKNVYSVKKHPKFLNGEWSEDQCLRKFLDTFDSENHPDGIVTFDEFVNYYAAVSASIDLDGYFDLMMRSAWKL